MEVTKESVIEALGNMTVLEIIALTKQLEEQWDVKAVPQVVSKLPEKEPEKSVAQTEFTVMIVSFPADKKMAVIKAVRDLTGFGLKESKELAEASPKAIKENVSADEAESIKAKLVEAGAVVELK